MKNNTAHRSLAECPECHTVAGAPCVIGTKPCPSRPAMNENEVAYIIIADNHDELGLPADYKFTQYRDREVAGKVAQKMADKKQVGFTVTMIVDGVRSDAGRYLPTPA